MTDKHCDEPMYLISESELGRIRSVIIEDATHEYQTGLIETIRARGPVVAQQAPAPLNGVCDRAYLIGGKILCDGRMQCKHQTSKMNEMGLPFPYVLCGEPDDEQEEHDAALIAQEREKWGRLPDPPIETCPICDVAVSCDLHFGVNGYPPCVSRAIAQARENVLDELYDALVTGGIFLLGKRLDELRSIRPGQKQEGKD